MISSRNSQPLTGFQTGVRLIADGDDVRAQFAGDMASEAGRPLSEILFTDELVNIITPETPNEALTSSDQVLSIERGAAIAAFSGNDFLAFDLAPEVGGPGFTVGYIAQSGMDVQVIPVTPDGDECALNELLVIRFGDVGECPDEALFFGLEARAGVHDARGATTAHIGSRNTQALSGFEFGIRITTADDESTYEFADDLASLPGRPLSEVIFTDRLGNIIVPQTRNTMIADAATVGTVELGATLLALGTESGGLFVDFDPQVGGPGLIVGYLAPLETDENLIPATPVGQGDECAVNDLLVLTFGDLPPAEFKRGDTDANGRYNVNDAVEILLRLFAGHTPRFDCDDAFDADDDGEIDMEDALAVVDRLFRRGPALPAPGLVCGEDPTDTDDLGCLESNCQ